MLEKILKQNFIACEKSSLRFAFTLLELLVAISVLSILLVILLQIVQSTTNLWRGAENKIDAYREARAALQVVCSDLKNVVPSANPDFFRTNLTNSPNIGFLSLKPISAQDTHASKSDICSIGYFLAYNNKSPVAGNAGRQSYNLYRCFVESNDTFERLKNNAPEVLNLDPARFEILARNVIYFKVTCFTTNGSGFKKWIPSTENSTPNLVEIKITSINNERTMRFGARNSESEWLAFQKDTNSPDYLKNTKTFCTRVKLPTM